MLAHTSLLALSLIALSGSPHRAPRPEAWWAGLTRSASAPAHGVHALEVPHPERVRIPGGTFTMGSSQADLSTAFALCRQEVFRTRCDREGIGQLLQAEHHPHEVRLSSFEIDRTEVSVGDYARCVATGACVAAAYPPSDPRFDNPVFPVTHVRWEDAGTYCTWAGGRLPTEAEWEFTARGTSGRLFPWGNVYNPHLANHGALAPEETDATDGYQGLAPVTALADGATPEGVLNLAGNAAEWVADFYDLDLNGVGYPDAKPQVNPKGPLTGGYHVIRGGSYTGWTVITPGGALAAAGAVWLRGAARSMRPSSRAADVGFRCARDAKF